jgi:hypothetical protein
MFNGRITLRKASSFHRQLVLPSTLLTLPHHWFKAYKGSYDNSTKAYEDVIFFPC